MNISCIFSDDFRREADGKYSLMGVYGREMLIATPSFTLPKLSITIIVKSNTDAEGDILYMSIEVNIDGKQQLKQEVPAEALKKVANGFKEQGFNAVQHTANILMTLLPVKTGNVIEAIVSINGKEMEPVTHFVDIYQRKEETLSPNSMQNRFSADFQFRIGKVHFLDDSMICTSSDYI